MNKYSFLNPLRDPQSRDDNSSFLVTTYNTTNPPFDKYPGEKQTYSRLFQSMAHIAKTKVRQGLRRNKYLQDHFIRVRVPRSKEILKVTLITIPFRQSNAITNFKGSGTALNQTVQNRSIATSWKKYTVRQKVATISYILYEYLH